ncbi:hypothetical protein [Nostoc sp. PA-18-2419]|uniref:hypothetical protein n=1 Tax=Nostoc sp. PA-18-2419 TaxID=2575443 RepID=UPI001675691F|nr:hypothetical protein [Nostoc sp. PA-18-2419]
MNRTLLTTLMFAFLVLFITSPFAALGSLMLVLLAGAFLFLVGNVFQALVGGNADTNQS